jgi:hypothetical protein
MIALKESAFALAHASKGNPITATITVMLFFLAFNMLEATVERLIFGTRFEHWLDIIFICAFIAYAAYAVWVCAALQLANNDGA